jgi:hypothetical protein
MHGADMDRAQQTAASRPQDAGRSAVAQSHGWHSSRVQSLAQGIGLRLRPATVRDQPAIREIARQSYPVPAWLFEVPQNAEHYRLPHGTINDFGVLKIHVAERVEVPGRLAAYVYFQIRYDGDCYLRDLAALPSGHAHKVPGAGTLLLASAMAAALDLHCAGLATLNVMQSHRGDQVVGPDAQAWRDPVSFYSRFGYRVLQGARGYAASSLERPPDDTWMAGDIAEVYHRAVEAAEALGTIRQPASRRDACSTCKNGDELR